MNKTNENIKTICPYCKEVIICYATKCKHCMSVLTPESEQTSPSDRNFSGNVGISWLCLILMIFSLLTIISDLDNPVEKDTRDLILGTWMFLGIPSLMGAIYVVTKGKAGITISYITIAVSIIMFIGSLGVIL